MKLTNTETQFVNALITAGGSYAPEAGFKLKTEDRKAALSLERKGIITIEQVDTGYRYSLREGADGS